MLQRCKQTELVFLINTIRSTRQSLVDQNKQHTMYEHATFQRVSRRVEQRCASADQFGDRQNICQVINLIIKLKYARDRPLWTTIYFEIRFKKESFKVKHRKILNIT